VFDTMLERMARVLDEAAIPCMAIRGQTMLLYGEGPLACDSDIACGIAFDRLDDLLAACAYAGLQPLIDVKICTAQTRALPCQDQESGVRADVLLSFMLYARGAIARARRGGSGGATVRCIAPEDRMVHKGVTGRPRALEDEHEQFEALRREVR
jgi:hypothetical protein